MKKLVFIVAVLIMATVANAQEKKENVYTNLSDKILTSDSKLSIGGYGEVNYNQGFGGDTRSNGKLDVQRFVMMLGYKFNSKTSFVAELEFEHVKEVYVEQAFLQYKINDFINFRAGLMLVPMGIQNEYHEPNTFNGVERTFLDSRIAPTTWREIGAGFTGNIIDASLKYQAYVFNGFNGYEDGAGKFRGKDGLRKGRQKGAESFMSSPNFAGKVEFYGIKGLNLGLSGYFGKTQSTAYDGLLDSDNVGLKSADSTVVSISMVGFDARYQLNALQMRAQVYYTALGNTDQYNAKTGKDLGSAMMGYYVEAGYNVLAHCDKVEDELIPFVRYEMFNTHHEVEDGMVQNDAYNNTVITAGLGWKITPKAALKVDVSLMKSEAADDYSKTFNAGVAVMF